VLAPVVVAVLVALLLVVLAPVVLVGVVGARRLLFWLLLLPLPLEVRPSHPSATHGQGVSRCGRFRVRGALILTPAGGHVHWCCSPVRAVLFPARSAQPAADLVWGGGTRLHWRSPSAPWG